MQTNSLRTTLKIAADKVASRVLGHGSMERAAHRFWNRPKGDWDAQMSHWSGAGIFSDRGRWLAVGREHLEMWRQFAAMARGPVSPVSRVVEWGCGGGCNAVHFAPIAKEFVGIDVSQDSLDECARQLDEDAADFRPVLIDTEKPELALDQASNCDLFLCTYVFELLPSPQYGLRVMSIAEKMLRPGGFAIVQIKYTEGYAAQRPFRYTEKRFAYTTLYRIPEFWEACVALGLSPQAVVLKPEQKVVEDGPYAYFWLRKR